MNEDDEKTMKKFAKDIVEQVMAEQEAEKRPTKEEILSIKNRQERQKAIAKNLDLFR